MATKPNGTAKLIAVCTLLLAVGGSIAACVHRVAATEARAAENTRRIEKLEGGIERMDERFDDVVKLLTEIAVHVGVDPN